MARALHAKLQRRYAVQYDDGGAIGKRYRRQDEAGTPWCVTIDFDTIEKPGDTFTLRDRDTNMFTLTVTGTGALFGFGGEAQPHWIDELGGCVAWDNSTNTTAITLITPGANPRTSLVLSTLPVAGGNAVTPPARRANGTYGRLFPWRSKRILVLINGNGASDAFYYRYGAL